MTRLIIFLVFLGISASAESETYVLLDAIKLPSDSEQPRWIALRGSGGGKSTHIAVGESITSINPGHYRIHHLDVQKSSHSGTGTMYVEDSHKLAIDVIPDVINFVGIVQITRRGTRKHNIQIVASNKLLPWACERDPEVFKRLPVAMIGSDGVAKIVKVKCET